MIRTSILTVLLAAWAMSSAGAEGVYEIRHASLKNKSNYSVIFWCLEKDQIPNKYRDSSKYSLAPKAFAVSESGALIMTYMDNSIYLTSEDCVDDTKEAVSNMGLDPGELTFTSQQ